MHEQKLGNERTRQLLSLARLRHALTAARTIDEFKGVRDGAERVRSRVKRLDLGLELRNLAAELKLQAERGIGGLLIELKLRGGNRRSRMSRAHVNLRDLGVDKNQSARWQLEASVPEVLFREFIRVAHAAGEEVTSASLIRLAKQLKVEPVGDTDGPAWQLLQGIFTPTTPGSLPEPAPGPAAQCEVSELAELVVDAKNHSQLVTNIFDSLCERAVLPPEESLCRALRRYLTEIEAHLESIGRGLRRLAIQVQTYESVWSIVTPQ